jgi:hypothetical protein
MLNQHFAILGTFIEREGGLTHCFVKFEVAAGTSSLVP